MRPAIGRMHEQLLAVLTLAGSAGMTDQEMQAETGIKHNTQRPRRRELEDAGLVFDSGERRATTRSRNAVVWTVQKPDDAEWSAVRREVRRGSRSNPTAAPVVAVSAELMSMTKKKEPGARAVDAMPVTDAPLALACEGDCFALLASLKGAGLNGCITDLPYPTLERHRARGTTTRLKASAASSNPWFGTMTIPELARALAGIYDALATNAYAFVYVDDSTALLLAAHLGVPGKLDALTYKKTSEAPRDSIGFAWWNPCTWVKTANNDPTKVRGGAGYHGASCTERILILEKGKSQLLEHFNNAFLEPRPLRPKGATIHSATAKPVAIAETLTRAMSAPGGRILDPFVGSGTHAEGIARAGCTPVVGDVDLKLFRDWQRNVFKHAWLEPRNGQWERMT